MKGHRAACVAALAAIALLAGAGPMRGDTVRITGLTVADLTPFVVTFNVESGVDQAFSAVRGQVSLSEATGLAIDQFAVQAFDLAPGGRARIRVESRWEFQLAGTYLVDATLDLGRAGLVSATLPLRIVPVPLPLASQPAGPGEMLTLAQEPANWGVDRVGARTAWTVTHGSPTVVVALIDSGIDSTVPQLADCLWVNEDEIPGNGIDDDGNGYVDDVHGWDFRDGDASSLVGTSLHGHGTSVAAIIAARPGRYPVVGIAPGVKLMDLRFLDSANLFRASDWKLFARAVEYAVDNGADLINLSVFANSKPPSLFEQALAAAQARGVLVVGIAGNQGKGEVMYPARNEAVLAVSACGSDDALASFSNYGPEIAFCAPGQSVMTFTTGGRVISQSGTSFAAPHVTGALALLLSAGRGLTAAQALAVLEATAVDLGAAGRDDRFGHGLVDAWAAMREALRR